MVSHAKCDGGTSRWRNNLIVAVMVLGAAVAAVAGSAPAPAATTCTRFASPAGSDAGTGSESAPYRTAQKLVASLAPGQVGCLMGGTYPGSVTFATAGVTLATAPGYPRATLSGGYVYIRAGATDVRVEGLRIDGGGYTGVTVQLFGDRAVLTNNEITNRHLGRSCVIIGEYEGSWATVVTGTILDRNRIHHCGMAANGNHDHGIYVASSRNARITNNVVYGNVGGWGIHLWADAHYTEVANNVLDGNYGGNVIIAGGGYSAAGPSSNNRIADNVLTWPSTGHNVESYWEGAPGTGNLAVGNCVYGAPAGNFGSLGDGYTQSGTIVADPLYVNRAAYDFRLAAGSPCAGKGPVDATTTTDPPTTTPAGFSLSASPGTQTLRRGRSVEYAIAIQRTGGLSADIAFSVAGLPAGVTGGFTTTGSGSAVLLLAAAADAARGRYQLTIAGTADGVTQTASAEVRTR